MFINIIYNYFGQINLKYIPEQISIAVCNKMKLLLISTFSFFIFLNGNCQTKLIPKTYKYFSEKENWTLRTFDFKTFECLVGKGVDEPKFLLEGNCITTDSTIQFQFYPSKTLDFIVGDTSFNKLNIKEIINGKMFSKIENYFIPKSFNEGNYSKKRSYLQQIDLDLGGTKFEFFGKNNYILTELTCFGNWIEKGNYNRSGNFLILNPNNKLNKKSRKLMDNIIFYYSEDFLITKKIEPSLELDKYLTEEVYTYYIRQ